MMVANNEGLVGFRKRNRRKLLFLFIGQKPIMWPANNCLQIMVCSCVNKTTRDRSCVKKGRSLRFLKIFVKKQAWWSNDKTIIELGYRKISWFASISHINYLPQSSASANNRPLALRGHVTNASFKQWVGSCWCQKLLEHTKIILHPKFERKCI